MEQSLLTGLIIITSLIVLSWKAMKFLWLRPKKIERCLRQQGLKGNPYKPFLGDAKDLMTLTEDSFARPISFSDDNVPRIAAFVHKTIQKHGKNCFAWIGPTPWLITTDHQKIKEILTKHEDFRKPNHPHTQVLMVGLFGHEGEKWAKHRKIINPAFHMEKLKTMLGSVYESCSIMTRLWEEKVSDDGSVELDVWPFLESLSADIISRSAFGSSYEEGRRIFDLLTEHINLALVNLQPVNYIPGWRFLPTKKNQRIKQISKEVEGLLTRMINIRKKEMEAGECSNDDLLGTLLESNMREIKEHDNELGRGLTTEEVVQECKLFYLAGSETSGTLLAWALILFSKHQIWQERARAEVLQVFGRNGKPNFEGLDHLKIVTMFVYEVLRLYTPGYILLRKAYKDIQLRELFVPAETELVMPVCIVHQDTSLWGDDAKEFKPERFADGVSKATKGQNIYFPFSIGPRSCIGQTFSLLEAKLAIAMMLQRFSFDLSPTYVHAPSAIFTVKPQYGANLILHKL